MAKKENIEEAEVTEVAEVKEVKQTKKTTKKTAKAETDSEVENEAPVVNEEAADEKKDKKTTKKTAKVTTEVEVNEEVAAPQEEASTVKKEAPKPVEDPVEVSVEQKLVALYTLQQVDSKIDEIRAYRGNLPLEIQDMEDEIAGLETRIANFKEESK